MRLDAPPQVRLHGKGNKVRLCPIWPVTAKLLRAFIDELPVSDGDPADALLFTNARGRPLTRFGVRYLLRRYVAAAAEAEPSLRDKSIHPHSLRHSTAIALLKSGVDFATISQWLGHAGLNTTMRYARADIDLKRVHHLGMKAARHAADEMAAAYAGKISMLNDPREALGSQALRGPPKASGGTAASTIATATGASCYWPGITTSTHWPRARALRVASYIASAVTIGR